MKVLSVCTSDCSGGASRAAYRIHHAVRQTGVDSIMLVKEKGTKDVDVLTVDDFIPHNAFYKSFDWVRNKVKNKWQHYQWGKYPEMENLYMSDLRSTDIGGALNKIDFDILHLHWINQRFLPLDQLPKDKPIVWTLHDSWPFCGVCHLPLECSRYQEECGSCPALHSNNPSDLSHKVWMKKQGIYEDLDLHIITPSHWLAECAGRSKLLGGSDIRVIPNSLDTEVFCPEDRDEACLRLGLEPNMRHVLFGAVKALEDRNKGFFFLMEALDSIGSEISGDTDLIIFGSDGPVERSLSGIHITCLGPIRDQSVIVDLYRASDVTVVPSLSENLSYTIMESLSCGTPVVAFDIGGNNDMIEHEVNGFLAKKNDAEDLAKGIQWCLNHNDTSINEAARRSVIERFTPQAVGNQYYSLYESLIKH